MSLWVVTILSSRNNTLEQYSSFAEYITSTLQVKLLTVEIAYNQEDFLLGSSENNVLQYRADYVLDRRYNLYNLALHALPVSCSYVAFIDVGVFFERKDIVSATLKELETNSAVQLFGCYISTLDGKIDSTGHSFMKKSVTNTFFEGKPWHSGKAWAFRKELLCQTKLADFCILGGGDSLTTLSLLNKFFHMADGGILPSEYMSVAFDYQCCLTRIFKNKIGFLRGRIRFPHTEEDNLDLGEAYTLLAKYNFIPKRDLTFDKNGLIIWREDVSPEFREATRKYFDHEED